MNDKRVDVASIGTLAVDYFALLPKIPAVDDKIMAEGYEIHPGGVAGNVITQVARLGISAGWMGKLGDDEAGDILLGEFERDGIYAGHAEVIKGAHSMFTWIQVDERGDKAITMFPNILNSFTADDVETKHKNLIQSAKILQAEACLLPLKPALRAMEIAKESGVQIVFDLDVSPRHFVHEAHLATEAELLEALELADVLIPCKTAAAELIGSDDIVTHAKKLLDYGPRVAAVTLGDTGCIVFSKDEFHSIPSYRVKVVDTTGAGDAFHGGFIYGIIKNMNLHECGSLGNACGALCCTRVGARSMGTLQEVHALMEENQRVKQ